MMMLYKQFWKARLDLIEMNRVWEQYQKCVQDLTDNDVDHFKSRLSVDEGGQKGDVFHDNSAWFPVWDLASARQQCLKFPLFQSPFPSPLQYCTWLHLAWWAAVARPWSVMQMADDIQWFQVDAVSCGFLQKVSVFRAKTGQLEVSTEDTWFFNEIKSLIYLLLLLYYLPDTGTVF